VADCGRFTGALYSQARAIIAAELGADRERYAVIFTGSGATAALHKLASALLKRAPTTRPNAAGGAGPGGESMLPVVFVGPLEHHSNDVLWREQPCTVVVRAAHHRGCYQLPA
jgi:selenocysteine lyase/cysteine desulfurase